MQDNAEYISPSRNYAWLREDATACHHCRETFKPGQTRFVILDETYKAWGIVPICMDCFKAMRPPRISITDAACHGLTPQRFRRTCQGCGEQISVPDLARLRYNVCSRRCYQRVYRKYKREYGSTIDWKMQDIEWPQCATCNREMKGHRKDAKFCSSACRQWAYRRRKHASLKPRKGVLFSPISPR